MNARLASETDLTGFREEARSLLAHRVPPEEVQWEAAASQEGDYYVDPDTLAERGRAVPRAATAIVPASFLRLCEVVVLHSDPERFALLYRLLWRLVHEPALRNRPGDADMLHAQQLGQSVRRDQHKMKAFVHFRAVDDGSGRPLQLAWYEPAHHIVEAVAPWFAKRMGSTRWAIFTPERSVESDGLKLHFGLGLLRAEAPAQDAPDASWLACYRRVFGERALALVDTTGPR